jgi:hypothetical protein
MGAAAPIARSAPPLFQMVGMARRRRPKLQARSAVCEDLANRQPVCEFECKSQTRAAPAADMGADGASPSKSRLALPRRLRKGCPDRSKWRDDLRVVPRFRCAAPSARSGGIRNRFLPFEGEFQTRAAPAAKMGPRRPPARSLRLGERGVPTIFFRWALPRRLRVRAWPSRLKPAVCSLASAGIYPSTVREASLLHSLHDKSC